MGSGKKKIKKYDPVNTAREPLPQESLSYRFLEEGRAEGNMAPYSTVFKVPS